MRLDGFEKIVRAGRGVTAPGIGSADGMQHGADKDLVAPNDQSNERFHEGSMGCSCQILSRLAVLIQSASSCWKVAWEARQRAMVTSMTFWWRLSPCLRMISRNLRLRRFRVTAFPAFLEVMSPNWRSRVALLSSFPRTRYFPAADWPPFRTI